MDIKKMYADIVSKKQVFNDTSNKIKKMIVQGKENAKKVNSLCDDILLELDKYHTDIINYDLIYKNVLKIKDFCK